MRGHSWRPTNHILYADEPCQLSSSVPVESVIHGLTERTGGVADRIKRMLSGQEAQVGWTELQL